jgi:outer membrane protein OmpA-like peptidoglycan-associated protein
MVGVVANWTDYREFNFDRAVSDLRPSEMARASEIAGYLAQNPSLEIGIDSYGDGPGSDQGYRDLSSRRAGSVRDALMQAGVPAYKIRMIALNDPRRRGGQVEVLIKTRA